MMDLGIPEMTVDSLGNRMWRLDGRLHRTDGPAWEGINGTREWWVNGEELKFSDWLREVAATEEQRMALIMRWA